MVIVQVARVESRRLRSRERKEPLPEALQDALARHESEGVTLEAFGEGRVFSSSHEFLAQWSTYELDTMSLYQSRRSDTVQAANAKRERDFLAKGESLETDAYKEGLIPDDIGHAVITRRCRHGVYKKSRGNGKRKTRVSSYLECPARITGRADRGNDGKWYFVTSDEFTFHNHKCTQAMLDSYGHSALLTYPDIARDVAGMMQAGALARNICDTVAANYGVEITAKQLANLKRDRLGGQAAVSNLKLLLQRFASFSGSRCVVIDDQNGDMCAIVMQSAAQRAMFDLYGDNLILDWTHNTNNLGFYLGSLMVTSSTGFGVSVCDFLCIEQTEAMMTTVFEYFIEVNPGAVERVKSFVIDKDYKEWRVLERLFDKSVVLLCQFHVAKWFAYVVTMRKYDMPVCTREQVLEILSDMIYANTTDSFDVLVSDLERLLRDKCPSFIQYMIDRWYSCRRMWSDCERVRVFTALNTTSNRLESAWNQIKSFLGKKLRIDLCVESVFAYQTAVMRREYRMLSKYETSLILRSDVDRFMRAAMAEVCDYACTKVAGQWRGYRAHDEDTGCMYSSWRDGASFKVTRGGPEAATYDVEPTLSRCSCEFSTASDLPCRHAIYIARRVLHLDEFPCDAIAGRWRIKNAFSILPQVKSCTAQIQTLRTALLLSDTAFSCLIEKDFIESGAVQSTPFARIAYKRMKRFEHGDIVVLGPMEKQIAESSLDELVQFLLVQSTPSFVKLAVELKEWVAERLQIWKCPRGELSLAQRLASVVDVSSEMDEAVAAIAGASLPGKQISEPASWADVSGPVTALSPVDRSPGDRPSASIAGPANSDPGTGGEDLLKGWASAAGPANSDPGTGGDDLLEGWENLEGSLDLTHDPKWRVLSPPTAGSPPPPPQPPSSVSTGDVSILLNPIVEANVARNITDEETKSESVASRDVSQIMHRVARYQLTSDAAPSHSKKKRPAPKSHPSKLDSDWFRDTMGSDYDEQALASGAETDAEPSNQSHTAAGRDDPRLLKRTVVRVIKGSVKKQKTFGVTGDRLHYVEQSSQCPVDLPQLCVALRNTPDIARVASLWKMYPRRFDEKWIQACNTQASFKPFLVSDFRVNFRVKYSLMRKLKEGLMEQLHSRRVLGSTDRVDLTSLGYTGVVDLTRETTGTRNGTATQTVVTLAPELRGFSKDNITDFEAFLAIRDTSASYKLDVQWLERGAPVGECDIPYLSEAILSRGLFPPNATFPDCNVSSSARQSILAIISSTTLNTVFRIPTMREDLAMSITVADIVGYAARRAELNDCVLMYALRQFASDYDGVHVADSVDAPACMPSIHLSHSQWAVFPRNFAGVHWGVIIVALVNGTISSVLFYDPLQGVYDDHLKRDWLRVCGPYMDAWATRDGLNPTSTPVLRRLGMNKQHDGASCGVYCVAVVHDVITGNAFFTKPDCALAPAMAQLRL